MNELDARMQLANDLLNLAEAIKDDNSVIVKELFGDKRELHIESVLGDSTTLIAVKRWTEKEIVELKKKVDDEWPEFILEKWEI